MIDAKELRIGNIVSLPSLSKAAYGCENVPFYVEELFTEDGEYKVLCHCETKEGYNCTEDAVISEIEPVPLTEELLLKCGFNIECYEYCIKEQRLLAIGNFWILHNCHNDFYGVMCSNKVVRKIEHLHQLQNIYYALTGEELEVRL